MMSNLNLEYLITSDRLDNRTDDMLAIRNYLSDSPDIPVQLISFLIQQKRCHPVCLAIFSTDFKTLYFTSKEIVKIDFDSQFYTGHKSQSSSYEILNARLCLLSESMMEVQLLSFLIHDNQKFCVIFKDERSEENDLPNQDGFKGEIDFKKLTNREQQVAKLVALGKTSLQIAEELVITLNTVKNHRKSIRRKLNITTRVNQMKMNEWLRNKSFQ